MEGGRDRRRPARRATRARRGFSTAGTLSLVAIASVLLFVSLPRLKGLALQENEADARATLELFRAPLLALANDTAGAPPPIRSLSRAPAIQHSLSDTDFLEEGRVLRRHGYLFRVVEIRDPELAETHLGILAWPWELGNTGAAAFLLASDGRVLHHPNQPARWSGPLALRTSALSFADWRAWPRRSD